ncbi:LSM-domain-containing protein [Thozetella sp. PMI_491]|nr:LSM-domain-containing protein [Thozetella sp. PMI_491]
MKEEGVGCCIEYLDFNLWSPLSCLFHSICPSTRGGNEGGAWATVTRNAAHFLLHSHHHKVTNLSRSTLHYTTTRRMADRPAHRGRGGYRGGRGGGGRGGGGGERGGHGHGHGAGAGDRERPKKENILDLAKYMDKRITVKFNGGREVTGTLKGYDALMNLVLDEVQETLRDEDGNESTRSLGLAVARGTLLVVISPVDGSEQISNPFLQQEGGDD